MDDFGLRKRKKLIQQFELQRGCLFGFTVMMHLQVKQFTFAGTKDKRAGYLWVVGWSLHVAFHHHQWPMPEPLMKSSDLIIRHL